MSEWKNINTGHPTKALFDWIMHSFYENSPVSAARLNDLYERGMIRRGIFFNPERGPLRTPKVNLITKEIEIHQAYISFLWCLCYNFVVLNRLSQLLSCDGQRIIRINDADESDKNLLNALTGWAFNLRDEYADWPPYLPNPTYPGDEIKMANVLLVEVVKFLLYHEIAHLGNGHSNYLELIETPNQDLTPDQLADLKALEVEADNYAYDMHVGPILDESSYNQAMGAIVALLSNLFVIDTPRKLTQLRHPDLDTRIFNLMNKIKLKTCGFK